MRYMTEGLRERCILRSKYHFIIIGSGWRALYYVRVAKALPEIFCLDAMYCRTQEKADLIAGQYQIHTTTSIEGCVAYKPDFAVVAVKKDAICDVSMEWLDRGITVLSETPAALDMDSLNKLYSYYKCGKKQVVAEQYREYAGISAALKLIEKGIIGNVSCANVSLAHEYHGMSLIRAFLGIKPGEKYTVSAKTYEFPTTQTLTRYDKFTDGRIAGKKRCVATFEFESGKVAWYDFDSEQYRSPIRKISFNNKIIYEPEFGLCGLSEDETAIAVMMKKTAEYSRGNASAPYSMEDALADAYAAILLKKAVETGEVVHS